MIEYLAEHGPGLIHWLILSNVLFAIGLYGLLSRRNAIGILMAVELMLNSAAMNVVVFNRFLAPRSVDGQIMALFVIAVAAAEVVVAHGDLCGAVPRSFDASMSIAWTA